MGLRYFLLILFLLPGGMALQELAAQDAAKGLCRLVNPFIGTGGHGHTFPGPTRPFGMVQLSPDTRLDGWDGCGGYHATDTVVYGFSHTHLSGTGIPDYCDILLMPTTGTARLNNGADGRPGYSSRLDKSSERAWAGYYSCKLSDYNILAELTSTERVGFHQYTFQGGGERGQLVLDLHHRDRVKAAAFKQVDPYTIEGYRISDSWAREQTLYFVLRSSEPLRLLADTLVGDAPVAAFEVKIPADRKIKVAVALSAVDQSGAHKNLAAELGNFDFEARVRESAQAWNASLGKIEAESTNTDALQVFYTALYHTLIVPNLYQDADGRYRGMDNAIHTNTESTQYTVFSLWDTYRAAHPLYTILEQRRTNDFIRTFLRQYQQGGMLPVWELAANETHCMIGYHSVAVIADAWAKGIRDYDTALALEAMKKSAMGPAFGLPAYLKLGYIPAEEESESVSKTLEYAFDDWCIAQMAAGLGDKHTADHFIGRAANYRNLFDPQSRFFRARQNQFWFSPFDPYEVNSHYTEANAWQYRFYVPQDISGMMRLFGGEQAFDKALDEMFEADTRTKGREQADITGLKGQYVQGNEPSHHMAYLYNFCGKPSKTQSLVASLRSEMFSNTPEGLPGNEDCGQMSAWYIFSAMGFYPVTPGSNQYIIGTPAFDRLRIRLENGKEVTIRAPGASKGKKYIRGIQRDGKPYPRAYLTHADLMAGGDWLFEMSDKAELQWGASEEDRPHTSLEQRGLPVAAPHIQSGERTFSKETQVRLGHIEPGATLFYTLDGSDPREKGTLFRKAIRLREDATLKFVAKAGDQYSRVQEAQLSRLPDDISVQLISRYAPQYAAGGDQALIDRLRGSADYRTGAWQGYQGKDLEFIVDLGKSTDLHRFSLGCLQDQRSWIFMPRVVQYAISEDGKQFSPLGEVTHHIDPRDEKASIFDFTLSKAARARYVRVRAIQFGPIPAWHLGAGGQSWIFADECLIE